MCKISVKELTSIDTAQDHPHKHPWREQKDGDQQVKNMVDLLLGLLDHCGLLDRWTSTYNDYIGVRLLLWSILWLRRILCSRGITLLLRGISLLLRGISRLLRGISTLLIITWRNYSKRTQDNSLHTYRMTLQYKYEINT